MSLSRQTKIIAALAAIFVMGASVGFAIALAQHPTAAPAVEKRWAAQELQLFKERLGLTPDQVESLRPVFVETARKMKQLHRETAARIAGIIKENTAQVVKELRPDQQERLADLVREKQELRDRKVKESKTDSTPRGN